MLKSKMRKYKWILGPITLLFLLVACDSPTNPEIYGINGLPLIYLTDEAREIVLEDFDYLAQLLLENAPSQVVLERRFGVTLERVLEVMREDIYKMRPIECLHFLLMDEADPRDERPVDELELARAYLSSLLLWLSFDLEGLGHLGPQSLMAYQEMLEIHLALLHQMEIIEGRIMIGERDHGNANSIPWLQRRADAFNQDASLAFYNLTASDINLYRAMDDFGFREEGNVTTEIIEEGRIAYLHIESFMNNRAFDSEILFPFYEEVQDFDHLIIDLRGNGGGTLAYLSYIIPMLIDEPIHSSYHEFFMAGLLAYTELEDEGVITSHNELLDILSASRFVVTQDFPYFNARDLAILEYVITWPLTFEPREDNFPFAGEKWILVDEWSASLSELLAMIAIDTGFATVVGVPTAGVTPALHAYISLPLTGVLYRMDIGYIIDADGRSIEEFGVIPDILIGRGEDALEVVLDLIN